MSVRTCINSAVADGHNQRPAARAVGRGGEDGGEAALDGIRGHSERSLRQAGFAETVEESFQMFWDLGWNLSGIGYRVIWL